MKHQAESRRAGRVPAGPMPAEPAHRRGGPLARTDGDGSFVHTGRLAAVRAQVRALDQAVVNAVAETPTPDLDRYLVRLSSAADYSRLWLVIAAGMAAVGGVQARRGAALGVLAVGAASAVSSLGLKPLARRRRPVRPGGDRPQDSRRVRRPVSASFPSGHTASAVAFASAVGETVPRTWIPLHVAAGLVGYSRVHTGVHYLTDVAAGAVVGALCGWSVRRLAGPSLARLSPEGEGRDGPR